MRWAGGRNANHSRFFITPVLKLKLIHSFIDTANIHYLWCARFCVIMTLPVIAEQSLSSFITPVSVFGTFLPQGLPLQSSQSGQSPHCVSCKYHLLRVASLTSQTPLVSHDMFLGTSNTSPYSLFLFRYNWHSLLILNNLYTNLWFSVRELHERFCLLAYHWIVVSRAALAALHVK